MIEQLSMLPTLAEDEKVEELEAQVKAFKEFAKQKRNWENAFQRWSDRVSQDGTSPYGCCGYGTICDYCTENSVGRPCVRALNEKAREKHISIDYSDRDFEKWFYL